MADEKVRYVLDVDDKGSPKLIKFGDNAKSAGKRAETAFDKAGKSVAQFGEQIPGVSESMQFMASGPAVMAGAAVAALGVGFAAMVKKQIDFADGMNDLSLRLGISTERLSVLSLYAEQSGTDIESLASAMGKLGVKISEGDKDLARWGITAGTADEALFQLADKIAATEDPMLRLKIATDAFGKSGQQMLPLLVQGGDALREMAGDAPIVSAEMAKMADEFNDKVSELKGAWSGLGLEMAESVLPAMTSILATMTEIVEKAKALNAGSIAKIAAGAASGNISMMLSGFGGIIGADQAAENERAIGAMSGPGGMGGYRGEDIKAQGRVSFGAGADPTKARSAKGGRATEVDFQAIDEEWQKQHGGLMGVSVDAEKALGPDYYANIPLSEKAMASLEAQRQKADAIADASIAKQQDQILAIAQSSSSVLANSFMQLDGGLDDVFSSIVDGFAQMLAQMAAELAANALILGVLTMINPALGAKFAGGMGGMSGLVLGGRATGGPIPSSGALMFNERREEAIVQRTPARVEPVGNGGDTYIFQVQNPAQASSLQRKIQAEKRLGTRGIR